MRRSNTHNNSNSNSNRRFRNGSRNGKSFRETERAALIDFIYENAEISKFKYEILKHKSDLPKIFDRKYSLMPNFYGCPSLLVFLKKREKYYQFVVDRGTLSYTRESVDFSRVKIRYVSADVDSSMYNGTILDGTYIESPHGNTFMISDVYYFKGDDMSNVDLFVKLLKIRSYLNSSSSTADIDVLEARNKMYQSINVEVCDEKPLEEIESYLKKEIYQQKYKVRGLYFYPDKSGTKLTYLFNNRNSKNNDNRSRNKDRDSSGRRSHNNHNHRSNKNKVRKTKLVASTSKSVYAVLEMKGVNSSASDDLYYLSAIRKVTKNGKKQYIRAKMGLADIPTRERSEWCRDLMIDSDNDNGTVLVRDLDESSVLHAVAMAEKTVGDIILKRKENV